MLRFYRSGGEAEQERRKCVSEAGRNFAVYGAEACGVAGGGALGAGGLLCKEECKRG